MTGILSFLPKKILFIPILVAYTMGNSQHLTILDSSQSRASFRGLSVPSAKVIWVSGSRGTIGKSEDAGKTWTWVNPKGFEKRDFRDIEAFDNQTAITMAVDSPGIILRTVDGGKNWHVVYENHQQGIFLDDLSFSNPSTGICIGDPMNGKIIILHTVDSGNHWTMLPDENRPNAAEGEAMFAASGTNSIPLPANNTHQYALVTGGKKSRLWMISTNKVTTAPKYLDIPIVQGKETTGANGIVGYQNSFYIIGGDFGDISNKENIFLQWSKAGIKPESKMPNGYKSSLIINKKGWIACGTTGVEWLPQKKKSGNWVPVDPATFHVIKPQPGTNNGFLAGANGKIGFVELK